MVKHFAPPGSGGSGTKSSARTRDQALAWAFLLPSLVVFAIFVIYPLGRTIYLSLHGSDLFGRPADWVGTDNYGDLFTSDFGQVLVNTLLFTLLTVVPSVVGALAVVLLLEARIRGVRFFRTAFALPFAFSVASASVIFAVLYNPAIGVLNGILSKVGVDPVDWLTDPDMAIISVGITSAWMALGYNVLVLSAGIGSIPQETVEAARLDGATGWRLARNIYIPMLSPQLFFLTVVSTINALQSFGQIHILTRGGPDGKTTTLVYSIYETAFAYGNSDFGLASAQAVVLMLVVTACTAVQFGVIERKVHYS